MREIKFVPSICKDSSESKAKYSGHVVLRHPTFEESQSYLNDSQFDINSDGKMSAELSKTLPSMLRAVSLTKKHIIGVALKRLSDELEIKTLEDMECERDCHPAFYEIAMAVINGFPLSKN